MTLPGRGRGVGPTMRGRSDRSSLSRESQSGDQSPRFQQGSCEEAAVEWNQGGSSPPWRTERYRGGRGGHGRGKGQADRCCDSLLQQDPGCCCQAHRQGCSGRSSSFPGREHGLPTRGYLAADRACTRGRGFGRDGSCPEGRGASPTRRWSLPGDAGLTSPGLREDPCREIEGWFRTRLPANRLKAWPGRLLRPLVDDVVRGNGRRRRVWSLRSRAADYRGTAMVKTEPSPGPALSAQTRPPFASAMAFTIDRPRPRP